MSVFCALPALSLALSFRHVPKKYTPVGQSSLSLAEHKIHLMQSIYFSMQYINIFSYGDFMNTEKRNSYGLFDAPVRSVEKERMELFPEDIKRQLEAGAFFMSREDAITEGFLSPHDEQDTVTVSVREVV